MKQERYYFFSNNFLYCFLFSHVFLLFPSLIIFFLSFFFTVSLQALDNFQKPIQKDEHKHSWLKRDLNPVSVSKPPRPTPQNAEPLWSETRPWSLTSCVYLYKRLLLAGSLAGWWSFAATGFWALCVSIYKRACYHHCHGNAVKRFCAEEIIFMTTCVYFFRFPVIFDGQFTSTSDKAQYQV
jgi:hypothetical protein